MNGAPAKPIRGTFNCSSASNLIVSNTNGVCSLALNSPNFSTSATERIGFEITGPTPALIFTSIPIPGRGVTISLYKIAASTL